LIEFRAQLLDAPGTVCLDLWQHVDLVQHCLEGFNDQRQVLRVPLIPGLLVHLIARHTLDVPENIEEHGIDIGVLSLERFDPVLIVGACGLFLYEQFIDRLARMQAEAPVRKFIFRQPSASVMSSRINFGTRSSITKNDRWHRVENGGIQPGVVDEAVEIHVAVSGSTILRPQFREREMH
jgi:hypothetical protein